MIRRVIQITGYLFLGLFGVFLIYANAESKPAQAKTIHMIVVEVADEPSEKDLQNLSLFLGGVPGVRAVQTSEESKKFSIFFEREVVTPENLISGIEEMGIDVKPIVFEKQASDSPECPVPAEYIQKFEQLKYSFNFRKQE